LLIVGLFFAGSLVITNWDSTSVTTNGVHANVLGLPAVGIAGVCIALAIGSLLVWRNGMRGKPPSN
jgi:hypothetical protein